MTKRHSNHPPRVPSIDPGPATTNSIRLWTAQQQFIARAAAHDRMRAPEWSLAHLLMAASSALGEPAPICPPMRRKPFENEDATAAGPTLAELAAQVQALEQELSAVRQGRTVSGTRKVAGLDRR